jgi:hypothetical protein
MPKRIHVSSSKFWEENLRAAFQASDGAGNHTGLKPAEALRLIHNSDANISVQITCTINIIKP